MTHFIIKLYKTFIELHVLLFQVSSDLKMARSLVRLAEIQATLQEQRILFLRQQMTDLERTETSWLSRGHVSTPSRDNSAHTPSRDTCHTSTRDRDTCHTSTRDRDTSNSAHARDISQHRDSNDSRDTVESVSTPGSQDHQDISDQHHTMGNNVNQ